MNYQTAVSKLGARTSRKLANNTYLQRRDDTTIAVRLHATDVLTFTPEGVTLNSGGWRTSTTKARINEYLPGRGLHQKNGIWYFSDGSLYTDGCAVSYDTGLPLVSVAPDGCEKETRAVKRRIAKYVKGFCEHIKAGELKRPGAGDCWFCGMREVGTGVAMGDLGAGNHSHLESHMEENYFVPSLLWSALVEKGYKDPSFIWQMIEADAERGRCFHSVAGALRGYMTKRLVKL